MGDLTGKTYLVTGATSGIGLEAAAVFAQRGATVLMVGRDATRTAAAIETVKRRSDDARIESFLCDFSSQRQIRALAHNVRAKYSKLDLLLNNAGLVNNERILTEDGIEATFAVNHLGPFLLTDLLLDLVIAAAPARIVNVASVGHKRGTMQLDDIGFEHGGYNIMRAYSRSKLANVMFTRTLAKRLEGTGVTVNALHPGVVASAIWAGAPWWAQPILAVVKKVSMISVEEGAKTLVYAATSPALEGKTGLYLEKNEPVHPSRLSQDEALAQQLWAASAKWVGTAA